MVISWTGLKIFRNCYPLFEKYNETKDVFWTTKAMEFGKLTHETMQANIRLGLPSTREEANILKLADDWIDEYEFTKDIEIDGKPLTLHGYFDLYSKSKNFAIEYKSGTYDELQLEFYSLVATVFLYSKKEGLRLFSRQKDEPSEELKALLSDVLNGTKHFEISDLCAICKFASSCPLLQSKVDEGDVDAVGLWLDNLQTQMDIARDKLRDRLEKEELLENEGNIYKVTLNGYTAYRLKKEYTKKNLLDIVIENNLINAIDFDNKVLGHLFPEMFETEVRKRLQLKRKE